jgi:hypothetical protein
MMKELRRVHGAVPIRAKNIALALSVLLFLLSLMVTACGPSAPSPASFVPSTAGLSSSNSSPTYDDLVKGEFVYPWIPRISAEDLKLEMDRGEKLILIDNRTEYKFKAGHLAGASNISFAIRSPFPGAEEDMDRKLARLPKNTLKILYCD